MRQQHFVPLLSVLLVPTCAASSAASAQPLFGVIRWDDWYNTSWHWPDPGFAIEQALSPAKWRDRVPWFCEELGPNNITCNLNQESVMDAEIQMAVQAGIDFWAFVTYNDTSSLSVPKFLYRNSTSPYKQYLKWCHILQTPDIAGPGLTWFQTVYVPSLVRDFSRGDYMLTQGNRPLVFIFDVFETAWHGQQGWAGWQAALTTLADAATAAGLGQPYVAAMVWSAQEGQQLVAGINNASSSAGSSSSSSAGAARATATPAPALPLISALSSYDFAYGASYPTGGAFETMAAASPAYWTSLAGAGVDVIPPVSAGWDPRPMNESALPWQNYTNPAYLVMPTTAELAGIVQAAINWTAANPQANPTSLHLLSAWNEFAEGHFIAPVLERFGGDERLKAIGSVLRPAGQQEGAEQGRERG